MTEFTVKIASVNIGLRCIYESTKSFFSDYLSDGQAKYTAEMTSGLLADEQERINQLNEEEGLPYQTLPGYFVEPIAVHRAVSRLLLDENTLLFHSSVVCVDGQAYAFTAKSGTGKSTHAALWRRLLGDRAFMINDDKPMLKITEEGATVFGSPWTGKHRLGENTSAPLRAIAIIEQSAENSISEISPFDAYIRMYEQTLRPEDRVQMEKYLSLLDLLLTKVKVYRLRCNMDISAAELSYKTMSGKE